MMMGSDFYFRDKIPVAVLGATSELGQRLVRLLIHHPWFEIAALCDSNERVGQPYHQAISESLFPLPDSIANRQIQLCEQPFPCSLIFSTLPSQEAIEQEIRLAAFEYAVVSCASYDLHHNIPLIVAEVNREQLQSQHEGTTRIVANPHCMAIGLSLALKPLMEAFGLETVEVIASHLFDESNQEKENITIEQQTLSLLGHLQEGLIHPADFKIGVQSHPASDRESDRASVSLKFKRPVTREEIIQAWSHFGSEAQRLPLPTTPYHILLYQDQASEKNMHFLDKDMSVYLEHLCSSSAFDYTFDLSFSHLIRGKAGTMLLNAELLVTQGKIYW